ncbi:MAG TPA: hypothetical protein VFL80_11550 [Thermoanaerobaculia bacterium]|nr:hypothetical protein [Thermoanaerobaculia bacterium]
MTRLEEFNLIWLTGASCDGCTISALGDTTFAPIEKLLTGEVPGLPKINLHHPILSPMEGEEFVDVFRSAERGEMDPYGLVVETSIPRMLQHGSYGWLSEDAGRLVDMGEWVRRLAARAAVVVAFGDCAVYGGPHSGDQVNPTGATGVEAHLGHRFRSGLGLPVVHLPGCCPPPVLISTLASVLEWAQGDAPPPELDELGRPVFAYAMVD